MYKYPLILTLKDGEVVEGTAVDTAYNAERQECVKVKQPDTERLVVLDSIATLRVPIDNPHVDTVSFIE